jgi:hypothetical protein
MLCVIDIPTIKQERFTYNEYYLEQITVTDPVSAKRALGKQLHV